MKIHSGMKRQFYLAPLRGVTDTIFRTAFERHFGVFDYLLAPFIPSTKGTGVKPSHVRDIAGEENDRARVIPQIIGNKPREFVLMTSYMASIGYKAVNWNLGCPHLQITRKKRGCGLMPYPREIETFLDYVIPRIPIPLSVKVRLGLEHVEEIDLLIPVFNFFPLREVIIHPRTGKQQYQGAVDLDRFDKASGECHHPVVYNGDIRSVDDLRVLEKRFSIVNRWMIGRGIAHDPFLLSELKTGNRQSPDYELLRSFHAEIFERNRERLCGPAHLLGKMKEFWWYLHVIFPDGRNWLKKIQRSTSVSYYIALIETMFGETG